MNRYGVEQYRIFIDEACAERGELVGLEQWDDEHMVEKTIHQIIIEAANYSIISGHGINVGAPIFSYFIKNDLEDRTKQ